MKDLQLTDEYTLHGLNKDEYQRFNSIVTEYENADSLKDETKKLVGEAMMKVEFGFTISQLLGDTEIQDCHSIPKRVANQIIETHETKTGITCKCFVNKNWKQETFGLHTIHEDVYSSINCALQALGNPFAVVITAKL